MAIVAILALLWAGDFATRAKSDLLVFGGMSLIFLALIYFSTKREYLEIIDGRTLINSGYREIGKDIIDIRDITYVYRYPNLRLKSYGSRMVIYVKGDDGKLRQSSVREVNFSESTLERFLRRLKQIKSNIELDSEYEAFLNGTLLLTDASNNTVASVENRLTAKGERWE